MSDPTRGPRARGALRWIALLVALVAVVAAGCSSSDDDSTEGTQASASKSVDDASADELAEWQKDLNAVGCWSGAVDGEMGPETENAIKEFQAAAGLTVDGRLGPETESALSADAAAGKQVCTGSDTTAAPTTPTSGSEASTCPGGPECYQVSVSPSSGAFGSTIDVQIANGGCGNQAYLLQPGGTDIGTALATTGPMSIGAGNYTGSMTVPSGIEAPENYVVATNEGPSADCWTSFEVTGP